MNIVSLLTSFNNKRLPLIIHAKSQGKSMEPLIKQGTKVLLDFRPGQSYSVGDIVAFKEHRHLVLHRLMAIQKNKIVTKGDNQAHYDSWRNKKTLVAKAKKIIYPDYTINLESKKSKCTAWFLMYYSKLNYFFPALLQLRNLYTYPIFKKIYRFFVT